MSLPVEDVRKVAKLARLKLTAEEEETFSNQLGKILGYIEMLAEVDTTDIDPMAHTSDVANVFRGDEPTPSLDRKQALLNAPQSNGKFFLVPRILEGV